VPSLEDFECLLLSCDWRPTQLVFPCIHAKITNLHLAFTLLSISCRQVVGLIAGILLLGFLLAGLAGAAGRQIAGILTVVFMLIGGILMTASDAPSQKGLFSMFSVAQVRTSPSTFGGCQEL
jgi:hypothetical protein